MNKNAKKRVSGQWSQGNSLYLSLYHYDSGRTIKLPLDYGLSEFEIDSDNDKLCHIYEKTVAGRSISIIALYDTSRIVFI